MASVDIRADKTFSLTLGPPMKGTWTMDDSGVAQMTLTKIVGQDLTKLPGGTTAPQLQLTGQVDDSDSTLSLKPAPGAAEVGVLGSLRFEKS